MSEELEQRWSRVPTEEIPVRRLCTAWCRDNPPRKGSDRQRVTAYIERQSGQTMEAWLDEQAAKYAHGYPDEPPLRCRGEAMLDLICWQRRMPDPVKALRWLKGIQ